MLSQHAFFWYVSQNYKQLSFDTSCVWNLFYFNDNTSQNVWTYFENYQYILWSQKQNLIFFSDHHRWSRWVLSKTRTSAEQETRYFHNARCQHSWCQSEWCMYSDVSIAVWVNTEAYSCHIKEKTLCRYNDIYVVITTYYVVITTYDVCR